MTRDWGGKPDKGSIDEKTLEINNKRRENRQIEIDEKPLNPVGTEEENWWLLRERYWREGRWWKTSWPRGSSRRKTDALAWASGLTASWLFCWSRQVAGRASAWCCGAERGRAIVGRAIMGRDHRSSSYHRSSHRELGPSWVKLSRVKLLRVKLLRANPSRDNPS